MARVCPTRACTTMLPLIPKKKSPVEDRSRCWPPLIRLWECVQAHEVFGMAVCSKCVGRADVAAWDAVWEMDKYDKKVGEGVVSLLCRSGNGFKKIDT